MYSYKCAVVSKTNKRKNNEDNYLVGRAFAALDHGDETYCAEGELSQPIVFAVADGMGGEESGEVASFTAVETLSRELADTGDGFEPEMLIKAIEKAHECICGKNDPEQSRSGMGSTIVAAMLSESEMVYTSIGDSRLYLMQRGKTKLLTMDHTESRMLIDSGLMSEEEAEKHPGGNRLTRFLGFSLEGMVFEVPECTRIKLKNGDAILLCSDGVGAVLDHQQIANLLSEDKTPMEMAKTIADAAIDKGGTDNTTAMVVKIEGEPDSKIKGLLNRIKAHWCIPVNS